MKKIEKIIIGTHNQGKFKEIHDLLPQKIIKISPKQLNIPSPEENGTSFSENSKIKAKFFSEKSNMISISDDSGLEIDLLSGAPGIFSSRWAGPENNFYLGIMKIFKELEKKDINWKKKKISCRFICCLTVFWPNGKFVSSSGKVEGNISNLIKGNNGFGYDPIFIPEGYKNTFAEMKAEFKYKIDHRFKAYAKIKKLIFN